MIKVEALQLGPLETNCYILTNPETNRALVIDPGMNPASLLRRIQDVEVEAILLTHAHFDHMGGVDEVRKAKNCPVYIHDLEAEWLTNAKLNGSLMWPNVAPPLTTEPAEYALADRQKLELIGHTFQVMHTPGHSPGSVSFLLDKDVFSGDVLFKRSVGRTDLPGGRQNDLLHSIHHVLFKLDDDVKVFPGHGPRTTIGYEKENNPYV